ncbi:amidohydrolase family protein [Mobilicoccus caccae]|uniref:Xaa-Pro dipeptidase n=1 Tax=Mobilicoccus caccae TaxID=1859295 RepID=A0ABQ6IMF7_9MICO|nr:amidohydrolase family protein [Mobilicoccus caccae]GMA38372.1 Xaa-Pro dipeptidase [Mobilicoccus caccae]
MCVHDHENSDVSLPAVARRNVLAGAAVLAGIAGVGLASSPAAAAAGEPRKDRGSAPHPPVLIVEGGALVDPETGDVTPDAVVVFARGRVVASGSRDATRRAVKEHGRGARVLRADGRWVVPGLIDVHVHNNTLEDAATVLRAGATSTRSGSSLFYQDVALAEYSKWAPGRVPRMLPAGTFVTPDLGDTILGDPELAPLAALRNGVRTPADLAHLTKVNLSRGARVIKTRANPRAGLPEQDPLELVYDREQLSAVVKAAGKAGVLCHAYSEKGIDGAVRAGIRSLEHGVFVGERTLAEMARRRTYFTPTIATIDGMRHVEDPVLRARGEEYVPVLVKAVAEAHRRGVPIVAGTDSFGTAVDPIGKETRFLHEAGLSPLEALRSATTRAARLLGWSRAGRLTPGAFADAVIVDSDPLQDGAALEKVRVVIAQGVVVRED